MSAMPRQIGRYPVREVIGTGAFSTVYRATDERLGADVAVKVLAENHSLDVDVRARFVEEARRLRRARGPHLLAMHEIGETQGAQPYMVLDLADRGDLSRRVAALRCRDWSPTPDDALVLAEALTSALEVLRQHRLVHRDLTPKNLLISSNDPPARSGRHDPLTDDPTTRPPTEPTDTPTIPTAASGLLAEGEQLVLADLGLSKDLAATSGLTTSAGTSGFTPPEQDRPGVVDHRADIWGASALVVWLALDSPPDEDGRWHHDVQQVPGWSRAVADVLARGLAHDPEDRPPTIHAWFDALAAVLWAPSMRTDGRDAQGAATLSGPGANLAGAHRGRARRRVRRSVGVFAALLVGAAGGAWLAGDEKDDGPNIRVEELAGDMQRTHVTDGDIRITLEGSTWIEVGFPVTLRATIEGAESWFWVGPDGALQQGDDSFRMTARGTGQATVRLVAVDKHGTPTEVSHPLEVAEHEPE